MNGLQTVLESLERLNPDELAQVRRRTEELERVRESSSKEDIEAQIAALHAATANFWEGYTQEEVDEIIRAMNVEFVDPDDLKVFDWLDELPEDQR